MKLTRKLLRHLSSTFPPPEIKNEDKQRPKRAIFPSLIGGRRGGVGSKLPVFLSKIVADNWLHWLFACLCRVIRSTHRMTILPVQDLNSDKTTLEKLSNIDSKNFLNQM